MGDSGVFRLPGNEAAALVKAGEATLEVRLSLVKVTQVGASHHTQSKSSRTQVVASQRHSQITQSKSSLGDCGVGGTA